MQFCRKVLCKPCSARVTSPEEDMEYRMGGCIGISPKQTEAHKDAGVQLTEEPTSQQSLLSQAVLLDVPVITGEESSSAGAPEDKEELEFPHDLLPSLDFSSELNIWESSLGAKTSSGERTYEQVNPLPAGLQHHKEVGHPLVVVDNRPHEADPLLTDAPSSPQYTATPPPAGQPLTLTPCVLLDQELLAAYEEYEEQMASLTVPHLKESINPEHEKLYQEKRKAGQARITKCDESSSPPQDADQSGHGNNKITNKSTHGNSETGCNQMDTVVFSFRDYILGTENLESEELIKEDKRNLSDALSEKSTVTFKQVAGDAELKEEYVESYAATGKISPQNVEEDRDLKEELVDLNTENQIPRCTMHQSDVDILYSFQESSELKCPDFKSQDVVGEISSEKKGGPIGHAEDDTQMIPLVNNQGESAQSTKVKKRDRKKHNKKKRAGTNKESEVEHRTEAQNENELQAVPFVNTGNHHHSEPVAFSMPFTETMTCVRQHNDHFCSKKMPSTSQSCSHSQKPHFINSVCSPSNLVPSHLKQSDNINETDAQCGENNIDKIQDTATSLINKDEITDIQITANNVNKESETRLLDDIISSEIQINKLESPLCSIQACVGESCVERSIEDALVEAAALPLTTPTIQEVIKSEGVKVSCDSFEGVATKAIADIGKGEAEKHPEVNEERKNLLDSTAGLSSDFYLLDSTNEKGQAVSKESSDSKMPHTSTEICLKGQRETSSAHAAISPIEEGDREIKPLRLEGNFNNFPHGILAAAHPLNDSAAGLEGGRDTGRSSFSLPEGAAIGEAEKKLCPPTDVAESCVKSPRSGETTITVTDSLCTEEELTAAFSPIPPYNEQSNTESGDSALDILKFEELPHSGDSCEASAITDTSLTSTTIQQVQPESCPPKSTTPITEVKIPEQARNQTTSVGKSARHKSGSSNRVRFVDSVKEDHSVTVEVQNMSMPSMGCASLPPLTVHESLYHPVVEASYSYLDYLSVKKPETSTDVSSIKGGAAFQFDTPKFGNDILLDKEDEAKNANTGLSGKDRKRPNEKCTGSTEHNDVKKAIRPKDAASEPANNTEHPLEHNKCEVNKPTQKDLSEQREETTKQNSTSEQLYEKGDQLLTNQEEIVTEKAVAVLCQMPKENDTPEIKMDSKDPISPDKSQEIKNEIFVVSEIGTSVENVTCKAINDAFTESSDRQLSGDLDSISKPKTQMSTCSIPPQTNQIELSCQPPAVFDHPPSHALVSTEPIESRKDSKSVTSVDLLRDESVISEAIVTEWSIPVSEQCASESPSMLKPQGPLLGDLKVGDGIEVSLSEGINDDNAACDITRTHMPLVDDQEQEEANDGGQINCLVGNNIDCSNYLLSDNNLTPLQEEKQSPQCVLANDDSNCIMTKATPDVINDKCPLSSNNPSEKCNNAELCDVEETQNMNEKPCVSLNRQTEQLANLKETESNDKILIEHVTQQNEESDKVAKEETGDLEPSHKYDILNTEPNMVTHLEKEMQQKPLVISDQYLHQTLAETMEHKNNRDTSPDFSSSTELNSLAQLQEQWQQILISKNSTDRLPGVCVEAFQKGGKTNSQVKLLKAQVSGVTDIVGDSDSFETLDGQDEFSTVGSSVNKQMAGEGKFEKNESSIILGIDRIVAPIGCDLNDSQNVNGLIAVEKTKPAHIDELGQGTSHELKSGLAEKGTVTDLLQNNDFHNSESSKGKTESDRSESFGDLQENHSDFRRNTVSAAPLLDDHDTLPWGFSLSEKQCIGINDFYSDISLSEVEDSNLHKKTSNTNEHDHSAVQGGNTQNSEIEKNKILDTVGEFLEPQCSNKSSAIVHGSILQTPMKGPCVQEIEGGNNVASYGESSDFLAKQTSEVEVIHNEATIKNGPSVTAVPQDKDPSSAGISNLFHTENNLSLLKTIENDNDSTNKSQPNSDTDIISIMSNSQDDTKILPQPVISKNVELSKHISFPTSPADGVVHPSACNSDFEQASANTVSSHVSDNSPAGLTTKESESHWITSLREAASFSQTKQESTEIQRPLPSLESPQQEFLTPTEVVVTPVGPEQINQEQTDIAVLQPEVNLAEQLEKEKTELDKKEEECIEEHPISSTAILAHQVELTEPSEITGEVVEFNEKKVKEPLKQSQKIINHQEPEKRQNSEHPKEEPDNTAQETTATVNDPALEEQESGLPITEHTEKSDAFLITSPTHILPFTDPELPAPSLASPSPEKTPPASPHRSTFPTSVPSNHQNEDPCPFSASPHLLLRSSDSDGAFETPESTTPVKGPADPQSQLQIIDGKGEDYSVSDPSSNLISDPLAIAFDEDRPIAASGSYNFEKLASESTSQPLTRSLSLQGEELDTSGLDGCGTQGFRPHSESFSVGTESNPGTLRRPRKVRPGTVKKKPLLRQNSNPEKPSSTSSTPEIIKRAKPQPVTPEVKESSSPAEGGSPAGNIRKSRKTRVDSPPPLPEENTHTELGESLAVSASPRCQKENNSSPPPITEDLPIPPSGSYKWDPESFEGIDPFKTGGSKIANSPVLGRKDLVCAPKPTPPDSPPIPAVKQFLHPVTTEASVFNPEEQPILPKRESVRLEFDYSEENIEASHAVSPPPKKLGKKPVTKMPLRKPKLGLKKPHPGQAEQLDNNLPAEHNGNEEEKPISKSSYNFDSNKWDDPNFNPFLTKTAVANSPKASGPSYSFDFDDSVVDPFKSSNKIATSPPKASASFELSSNDDMENDNDNIGDLEDQNQNKPAKKKKTPIKSNTFRVKRSPKKSQLSDNSLDADDPTSLQPQDDHATDEEKLASSTNHKWGGLHDVDAELNSDQQDFPQPSDLTSFVNERSLQSSVQDYEIEYMEKIGSSSPPLSVKKPLYLKLDSLSNTVPKDTDAHGSEPNSPCTGSFEEMEAQITASMKSPVLSTRPGPEGSAGEKGRKRESEVLSRTQSTERDEQLSSQEVPASALTASLLERLSECDDPVQYLEPDLAETNPNAFAQKLQHRDVSSTSESSLSKNSLYVRTASSYIDGDSPHLPKELDHSLGIAKEEIVTKEKEVLEWQRKYEDSRQEVQEMRRIVSEYEKTIAQMIEDDQKEKSLSHHTIQQLIVEKDQALADLNSVEKSLADLFRRYEKMKDVLEGFRKNEEVLKKCAQEYLSRVRKEEQRYQALKIHAEEKLDKANSEIAQVRAKSKQEQAAHQASLRKEQMKVESLERTLEQKNKEIEELTKICDELIAKMGKC
ncbi:uncharacterized protein tacc2 isoform X3 [Corythoichthys intestinalis]|uniref:uncharacterized protein tacc2 isoform X3 n=1 Tax=Corythoichthys intestinalis TaxID=161448 RepID=UPI0025A5CE1C|nr:uncharacterized protein tacc2 isoform X3 [Corythoichthys intestinalis]